MVGSSRLGLLVDCRLSLSFSDEFDAFHEASHHRVGIVRHCSVGWGEKPRSDVAGTRRERIPNI